MNKILEVKGLSQVYGPGCTLCFTSTGPEFETNICPHCGSIVALHDLSFDLYKGEILGIMGESGSGKSTAVKCLYFDQMPYSGSAIFYDESEQQPLFKLNPAQRRSLRNHRFGMVYQNPNLGLNFDISAGGNIAERLLMSQVMNYSEIRERARELLA
ncbi:MAG: ATP-binding cassette domain-containing protein, partial [Nitrosomonas sp.]